MTTIGQVVVFEGRRAVICKKYGTVPVKFGVVFLGDYSGRVLNEGEWTVTGEVVSQNVVEELLASHERVTAGYAIEMERAYMRIRAEESRETQALHMSRNRGH
jgi:hypothetical protein